MNYIADKQWFQTERGRIHIASMALAYQLQGKNLQVSRRLLYTYFLHEFIRLGANILNFMLHPFNR